ncbi:ribosome-associated translation inhibitor RaiA [Pacificimonas sp. WHA3]|uniref:Ribosome hibernation promoting factor n=1 Tax=Pacificimonas pallii TaxID=2827236 RepID=A0ABS6SBZ9_9SPHN|nr:ribosome-associated translation inhibitor RaiA [Pacificimonas pallii]MBV7255750.1 ribosome-associated translation inhibitor RaiA [Pacificimonas pallii]
MDIRVSGHQIDVGASLTTHAKDRIVGLSEKYPVGMTGANVTVAKGAHEHEFDASILVQASQGLHMKSHAHAFRDAQAAFDAAAEKLETQLRRYKRKLTDRDRKGAPPPQIGAEYRVLQRDPREELEEADEAPLIIAESAGDIPECSVATAVMMLDLRDTPALMFTDNQSGKLAMVYQRQDGHIGWVEPK